jgi:hypothetical protein
MMFFPIGHETSLQTLKRRMFSISVSIAAIIRIGCAAADDWMGEAATGVYGRRVIAPC